MISFAMPAVWAGVNLSSPGTRTGTSFPANSTCGGRPGLNIRSLTLSEARSISRRTATKFSAGGPGGWVIEVVGDWLLILELFVWLARQKLTTTFANEYCRVKNKLLSTYV